MHDHHIGAFTSHDSYENLSVVDRVPHRFVRVDGSWPRGKFRRKFVMPKIERAPQQPRPGAAADVLAEANTAGRVWFQTLCLKGKLAA